MFLHRRMQLIMTLLADPYRDIVPIIDVMQRYLRFLRVFPKGIPW
jgi:hypothetical protein